VPDDVSVVAVSLKKKVQFLDPPLTTVQQPVAAMGADAVPFLVEAIGGQPVPSLEYIYTPELVLRGSTGRGPG
jgi:DNA-binding LacI/PurR family transcriptional regulator